MEKRYFELNDNNFKTRSADDGKDIYLEGYFVRYDDVYEIAPGVTESIRKGALTDAIKDNDVRALINHDSTLVLGRTGAGTFTLEDREEGLFGRILINKKDTDAMNAYARCERGDISGCSIGFDIEAEECEESETGKIHYTITKIFPLYEGTVCTFPAYGRTSINARSKNAIDAQKRIALAWQERMKKRLRGENNGVEGIDA